MDQLPIEVRATYIAAIDEILKEADLNTISSKRVRESLQQRVDYDITPHKEAIKQIILDRFDKFSAGNSKDNIPTTTTTNGHTEAPIQPAPTKVESEAVEPVKANGSATVGHKRSRSEEDQDDMDGISDAFSTPPKKRKSALDDDAAFAARLQAEENSRARPTRGGNIRKAPAVKKKKKKTAAKVSANDDSDVSGSDAVNKRKVNRNSGFHKEFMLSAPLSQLLDGETQLSRPQTVKRIWAYIKARDLQDPNDKRQIRCDDALRAVFKQDKVHMFSMNKILSTQLYEPGVDV